MKIINSGELHLRFDIQKLQHEVQELLDKNPLDSASLRLSLKHRLSVQPSFYDGARSLYNEQSQSVEGHESDFTQYHPSLHGTYLYEVCQTVEAALPIPIGRVRIAQLPPKRCLRFHADTNLRFHIPLFTHDQAYFLFSDSAPVHLPANGSVFWVNTIKQHAIFNGSSTQPRLHLLFSTASQVMSDQYKLLRVLRILERAKMKGDPHSAFWQNLKNHIHSKWNLDETDSEFGLY